MEPITGESSAMGRSRFSSKATRSGDGVGIDRAKGSERATRTPGAVAEELESVQVLDAGATVTSGTVRSAVTDEGLHEKVEQASRVDATGAQLCSSSETPTPRGGGVVGEFFSPQQGSGGVIQEPTSVPMPGGGGQDEATKGIGRRVGTEIGWRQDGRALVLGATEREAWRLRLLGAGSFTTGTHVGAKCWIGEGDVGPRVLAAKLREFRAIAEPERMLGEGKTSGVAVVPFTGGADAEFWAALYGFHVVGVYQDASRAYELEPERVDDSGTVALALYWPSATDLVNVNKHEGRNPWWAGAPQLTGEEDRDVDRIRTAMVTTPLTVDPAEEQRREVLACVTEALRRAEIPDSERPFGDTRSSTGELEHLYHADSRGADSEGVPRALRLMAFDAVIISGKRGRLLVDTGASRSHGSMKDAERLGWAIRPLPPKSQFHVKLADGRLATCANTATVTLEFKKFRSKVVLYLMPSLPGYNVILGNDWLEAQERAYGGEAEWQFSFTRRTAALRAEGRRPLVMDGDDRTLKTMYQRAATHLPDVVSHAEVMRAAREGADLYVGKMDANGDLISAELCLSATSSKATEEDVEDRGGADEYCAALWAKAGKGATGSAPEPAAMPMRGDLTIEVEVVIWDEPKEKILFEQGKDGTEWLPHKRLERLRDDMPLEEQRDVAMWESARLANAAVGAAIPARAVERAADGKGVHGVDVFTYGCVAPKETAVPSRFVWRSLSDMATPAFRFPDRAIQLIKAAESAFARSGGGTTLSEEERADDGLMGDLPHERPAEEIYMAPGCKELVQKLDAEFQDVLRNKEDMELPPHRGEWDFRIETEGSNVACSSPRKLAPDGLAELNKQLQEMARVGMARQSDSTWGAPVLFARKKDGSMRLCFDYRALNTLVKQARGGHLDSYSIPDGDGLRQTFADAKVLSVMDALAGYWQIRVADEHVCKTAVRTPLGSWEFLVMGFGHAGAPAHFQRWMAHVLAPYLHKFVVVFIDDICVFSKSVEEHTEHLRLVMERLRKFQMKLKRNKCRFYQTEVEFLGHRVGAGVCSPVQDKLAAVREWPQPTTRKALKGFLGLAGYYSDFVQGYSEISAPLTELVRDEADVERDWNEASDLAFNRLKMALTSSPVLKLVDTAKPYQLYVDASGVAAGAVLMQEAADGRLHPVGYFSKKFSKAERRYGATARELLGLVLALRRWRHYLMGSRGVELWTDCKPLTWLRTQQELQPMHLRWLDFFEGFDLELKYVKGVQNVVADALSRRQDFEVLALAACALAGAAEGAGVTCGSGDFDEAGLCLMLGNDELFQLATLGPREPDLLCAAEEAADDHVRVSLEDCLVELRSGYRGDTLVARAEVEATLRSARGERAPESEALREGRPDPAVLAEQRREAKLAKAVQRVERAKSELAKGAGPSPAAAAAVIEECLGIGALAPKAGVEGAGTGLQCLGGLWFRRADSDAAARALYIPEGCELLRKRLTREAHEPPYAGHVSAARTRERLRRHYWWPGMTDYVQAHYDGCRQCAVNKTWTRAARGVFSPNEVPSHRWEIVSMDFLSGIPLTESGCDFLMVVVDRLTKRLVLIPTTKEVTGQIAAKLFVERVFREHGLPRAIISDRDPRFTGAFWRRLHDLLGTRIQMSTADHPQSDGQSERAMRTLLEMLRHYVGQLGTDWDEHLWAVEFAYNDAVQSTLRTSPFQADLGRDPSSPYSLLGRLAEQVAGPITTGTAEQQGDKASADDFAANMREQLSRARAALFRAQRAAELVAAGQSPGMEFVAGEYVFVREDATGTSAAALKLGPLWLGPVRVAARQGANAYKLMLPKDWKMHPVVNVGKLKPAGEHRPAEAPGEAAPTGARVLGFVEHTEDGERRLRVKLAIGGRVASRGALLAKTAATRGGFDALEAYAAVNPRPLLNYLGRVVQRSFLDVTQGPEGTVRPFRGIIIGFDPTNPEQQFEVLYEDKEIEWMSMTMMRPLLQTGPQGGDVVALAAMKAVQP